MESVLALSPDPTHVIGLYPDLLPSDYRKQLHYPNPLPTLSGAELEKAHLALIDYLTQVSLGLRTWRPLVPVKEITCVLTAATVTHCRNAATW